MLNILLMMIANLVGFVLGTDGVRYMLQQLMATWQSTFPVIIYGRMALIAFTLRSGMAFMVFACSCIFIGVQIMFEYREEESRQGIQRKC